MAKGNLLKSMFGIVSNSSKNCKKNEENCKHRFDDTLLKDPVAITTYKTLEYCKEFLDELQEYCKSIINQVNEADSVNIFDQMLFGRSLIELCKDIESLENEDYFEACGQIYTQISIESFNALKIRINSISTQIDSFQLKINDETLYNHRRTVMASVKNINTLKKNLNNANEKSNNSSTKRNSTKDLPSLIAANDSAKEELKHSEDKLEDEINQMELYLILLCCEQNTTAETFLQDIIRTRNHHVRCKKLIQQKLYNLEDNIFERISRPILGASLRELRTTFNQDISVFLTRAFRFLIDNNVLNAKDLFDSKVDDDKMYALKEFLLSGVLDLTLFKKDLNIVTEGILLYLRELPDPLIHIDNQVDWDTEAAKKSYVRRCHLLVSIINALSYLQRINLMYLMAFLNFLHIRSNDDNLTYVYLAKIFVPCIFSSEYLQSINVESLVIIFADVVTYFKTFFPTEYKRYNFGQHIRSESISNIGSNTTNQLGNNLLNLTNDDIIKQRYSSIDPIDILHVAESLTRSTKNKSISYVDSKANMIDGDLSKNVNLYAIPITQNNEPLLPPKNDTPKQLNQLNNQNKNSYDGNNDSNSGYKRKLSLNTPSQEEITRPPCRGYSVSFCVQKFDELSKQAINNYGGNIQNKSYTTSNMNNRQTINEAQYVDISSLDRLTVGSEGQLNFVSVKDRIRNFESSVDRK